MNPVATPTLPTSLQGDDRAIVRDDGWSYSEAFARNAGLITRAEQERLRRSRVAIAGMGGVGGVHLITLARLGIGRFTIADPDTFETANFNRQYGAKTNNLGRGKADAMAEEARSINPQIDLRVFHEAIGPDNISEFLDGVDILVDGIDFFAMDARRLVFQAARQRGIWAVTAGPVGFSTAWMCFDPNGMSFDEYFDLRDSMSFVEQVAAMLAGLAPRATHRVYMDLSRVQAGSRTAPSLGLGCQLASGVAATEVAKILLDRGPLRPAPWYFQFDAYRQVLRKGRLAGGNRHPLQRWKRRSLVRMLTREGKQ